MIDFVQFLSILQVTTKEQSPVRVEEQIYQYLQMKTKCVREGLKKTVTRLKNESIRSWEPEDANKLCFSCVLTIMSFSRRSLSLRSVMSKQALNAKLFAIDQVASLLLGGGGEGKLSRDRQW